MKSNRTLNHSARLAATALVAAAMSLPLNAQSSGTRSTRPGSTSSTSGSSSAVGDSRATTSSTTSSTDSLKRGDRRFLTKAAEGNHKEVAFAELAAQRASNTEIRAYAQKLADDHRQMGQELMDLAQRKGVDLMEEMTSAAATTTSGVDSAPASVGSTRSTGGGVAGGAASGIGTPVPATGDDVTRTSPDQTTPDTVGTSSTRPMNHSGGRMAATTGDLGWRGDRQYRRLSEQQGAEFDEQFVKMMVDDHEEDVKAFEKHAKDADDTDVRAFAAKHLPALRDHLERARTLAKMTK